MSVQIEVLLDAKMREDSVEFLKEEVNCPEGRVALLLWELNDDLEFKYSFNTWWRSFWGLYSLFNKRIESTVDYSPSDWTDDVEFEV